MSFEEEIISLIESEKKVKNEEKDFFDCKSKWYEKKIDLLHDIICMANNLADRDAYIIIGVEDETFSVVGVDESDPNRKNTQQLTNFLVGVKFAGDNRPSVEVKTITYKLKYIDVIVIKRSNLVPYYLSKDYPLNKIQKKDQAEEIERSKRFLRCGNIYTRKENNNTAVNCAADPNEMEQLWKRRFFLDRSPLDRVQLFLKNTPKWIDSPLTENIPDLIDIKYYENFPEFTIKVIKDYSLFTSEWYMSEFSLTSQCNILICYQGTVLQIFKGVCEFNGLCKVLCLVEPYKFSSNLKDKYNNVMSFYYVFQDDISYSISKIFKLNQNNFSQFLPIVEFVNQKEYHQFLSKYQLESTSELSIEFNLFKDEYQNDLDESNLFNFHNKSYFESLFNFAKCVEKLLNKFRQQNNENHVISKK